MPREALWVVLGKLGYMEKFVSLLRVLHDNMQCCVSVDSEQSDLISVTCGVKQGCVYRLLCLPYTYGSGQGGFA